VPTPQRWLATQDEYMPWNEQNPKYPPSKFCVNNNVDLITANPSPWGA